MTAVLIRKYRRSFVDYLNREGIDVLHASPPLQERTYLYLAGRYPEHFAAWRTAMLLTTGIDPVDELNGYPLRYLLVRYGDGKKEGDRHRW
jgi:hypothetical protein